MEFSRIVGKNLKQEFYESIDQHSPRLLELFRSKRGNVGQLLTQISQQTNSTEPTAIRTQVLRGLPIILGDALSTPQTSSKQALNLMMMIIFVTLTLGYFLLSMKVLCLHLPSISVQPY